MAAPVQVVTVVEVPDLVDGVEPVLGRGLRVDQVVDPVGRVDEEDLEVPDLWPDGLVPGDLALQHHVAGVHVVEVGPLRQQEHPTACPESLFLVQDACGDTTEEKRMNFKASD